MLIRPTHLRKVYQRFSSYTKQDWDRKQGNSAAKKPKMTSLYLLFQMFDYYVIPNSDLPPGLGWMVIPQNMSMYWFSKPRNVTLFDKRVSVDVIRDFEMRRSSWIIWVGSESNDKCLIRGTWDIWQKRRHGHTEVMWRWRQRRAMWLAANEAKEHLRRAEAGRGEEQLP